MKKIISLLIIVFCISLVSGCEKPEELNQVDSLKLKSAKVQKVTVPFKLDFYTIQAEDGNGSPCEGSGEGSTDSWVSAHQIGEGNGTHLGKFSVDAAFCFYSGPDEFFGKYINALFVFTAANGDELYGFIDEGLVIFFSEPDENGNVAVYNDLLKITGGTGQFEGAEGEGNVISNLPLPGTQWQHTINSTITLIKGKNQGK